LLKFGNFSLYIGTILILSLLKFSRPFKCLLDLISFLSEQLLLVILLKNVNRKSSCFETLFDDKVLPIAVGYKLFDDMKLSID
jgi:hypothetical protein